MSDFLRPARSTTASSPVALPQSGWSMNATRWPSGETRGWLIQPPDSHSSVPIGYSSRLLPPSVRTTASSVPSGDQSAHSTPSARSRGVPPASATSASVPRVT